ncbi:hypothetical protein GCM10009304_25340 [Pseudomonas matsuisoli]|uniref:Uncharacterized protein n=1 Tax=Pseudomonas matsuisoli TaxID=1515666 RepID=A0A917PXW1_9PSED|nr:hypothetical protein GCM10009304_25340 [Pseudomonas matsuisoli]
MPAVVNAIEAIEAYVQRFNRLMAFLPRFYWYCFCYRQEMLQVFVTTMVGGLGPLHFIKPCGSCGRQTTNQPLSDYFR